MVTILSPEDSTQAASTPTAPAAPAASVVNPSGAGGAVLHFSHAADAGAKTSPETLLETSPETSPEISLTASTLSLSSPPLPEQSAPHWSETLLPDRAKSEPVRPSSILSRRQAARPVSVSTQPAAPPPAELAGAIASAVPLGPAMEINAFADALEPDAAGADGMGAEDTGTQAMRYGIAQVEPEWIVTPLPIMAQIANLPLGDREIQTQAPLSALDRLIAQADRLPPPEITPSGESGQTIVIPGPEDSLNPPPLDIEGAADPNATTEPTTTPNSSDPTLTPGVEIPVPAPAEDLIELSSDRQEYDTLRRIFYAEGNAVMRFRNGTLAGDRLRVNLPNRTAYAEGNVVLTRGQQVIRGDRFTYNLGQEVGTLSGARGEIYLPSTGTDLGPALPSDVSAGSAGITFSDLVLAEQPLRDVTASRGLAFSLGTGRIRSSSTAGAAGELRRLRFEAENIELDGENWVATNVRLTNDPFSPPELELRSSRVRFTRLSPTRSEIRARRPRAVFDRGFSLPLLRDRIIIDDRQRDSGLFQIGFDQPDRDGLFIQRTFDLISSPGVRLSIRPQFLVQRALFEGNGDVLEASSYGLVGRLEMTPDPLTFVRANVSLSSLDLEELDTNLRASVRAQRQFRTPIGPHTLALEYSYRDRLFNGSLGFQNVQSSLGFVLTSSFIRLGRSGIGLSYQVGAQYINANTDRQDLLPPIAFRDNNRIDLGRFQASAALSRGFLLWADQPLPPTPTEGLRYTPIPVVPYLQIVAGLRGVLSHYTSGDTQASLTGSIGLQGQFGHFSRPAFDYTAFNVTYSQAVREGESPFLFDRFVDERVISANFLQQIYGPFRFGFQTSINLDRDREIDTTYILEYSRRTYAIALLFNPVRETGALTFRISDFNWNGTPEPFSGLDTGALDGGVPRSRN
ncbi:MAG TPA: DUF3769 domain-containing protein [Chroococcidiopsis sp.]